MAAERPQGRRLRGFAPGRGPLEGDSGLQPNNALDLTRPPNRCLDRERLKEAGCACRLFLIDWRLVGALQLNASRWPDHPSSVAISLRSLTSERCTPRLQGERRD